MLHCNRRKLSTYFAAFALTVISLRVAADDLDIYTNPTVLSPQAPITALALDLSLTDANQVLCSNVLLSSETNCVNIRSRITLGELTALLGVPATIVGGLNPSSLLSDLNSGVLAILATPISATATLSLTKRQVQILGIQQILEALVNSRVTVLLNHANKGPAGQPCAFADNASVTGYLRRETVACSNGAYLFAGLTNLADPAQLAALTTKLITALLPPSPINPNNPTTVNTPTLPNGVAADHPYQTKEIYAELAKYLRGDDVFNGHLGYFDYGDTNAVTNLDTSYPLLSWDKSAETGSGTTYRAALADYPKACTINVIHVQATQASQQDDSDKDLKILFPFADADGDQKLSLPEVVNSAATDGFRYGSSDTRLINSAFVVQDNLYTAGDLSDLSKISNLGYNVTTYDSVLGLLGRGQSIASSLIKTLSVDASVTSLSAASSRSSKNGLAGSAYLPVFRPTKDQTPAWPGNLKKLNIAVAADGTVTLQAQNTSDAIAGDGRIRNSALTFWTDPNKLGSGVAADGRKADLGGAGQNVTGYQFGGGGSPARGNPANASQSGRVLYFDSYAGNAGLVALNPDDAAVRSELLGPTGAKAVNYSDASCQSSCQNSGNLCNTNCNNTGFSTNCSIANSTCLTNCAASSSVAAYNASCDAELASCNAGCPAGLGGATCRAACTTTRTTCPATKQTACTASCATQLAQCPAALLASCTASCSATQTTCSAGCSGTRTADTVTRELLLYARGYDVGTTTSPKGNGGAATPTNGGISGRSWLIGAALHSRPLAIPYGSKTYVVFGTADGYLHMIDDDSGKEIWAFMPQAVMGSLQVLRDNVAGSALPYGFDGSPVALIKPGAKSTDAPSRVLIFAGLRRGGVGYYALDITNPTGIPQLVWKIGSDGLHLNGGTGVATGTASLYTQLGLSFPTPKLGKIRIDGVERTVVIFGGGYNGGRNTAGNKVGKDLNNSRAVTPVSSVGADDIDRGNALYMVDANTGALLWRATRNYGGYTNPLMQDSIAGEATVLDTDNDGYVDRLYVGDTGGRLWRADFPGDKTGDWTFGPVANVGRHSTGATGVADDRRIFFAPDYVPVRNKRVGYDVILFGTGDREDPLNTATQNWIYAFVDDDIISGKPASSVATTEKGVAQHSDFTPQTNCAGTACQDVTTIPPGYRIQLTRSGEKLYSAPVTLGGVSSFSTYIPPDPTSSSTSICVPSEGAGRIYSINLRKSMSTPYNRLVSSGRDGALAAPGLPGEVSALSGTTQGVGAQTYSLNAKPNYRTSWSERLGEDEKAQPTTK